MMGASYGLVLGQGRSGTNWIMDCLDASRITFCRNEPDECIPSFFDQLTNSWRIGADGAAIANQWDELVGKTITHMGERDHRLDNPKVYVNSLSQAVGVAQLSARLHLRFAVNRAFPNWSTGEWKMQPWIGDLNHPDIFAVIKLVQSYNWATWVLENRPEVPVVQIVRHPGGRHESFLRRYIARADAEQTRLAKIEQLRELMTEDGLGERIGNVDELSLAQAETWFGVYQMEVFEQRAQRSPKYLRVVYEDMVADPGRVIERIFDHFGLTLDHETRTVIDNLRGTSVFGAVNPDINAQTQGWRDRLSEGTISEIEEILATSTIQSWWPVDEIECETVLKRPA